MFTRVALAGAMMLGIASLATAQQHRTWYLAEGATNAFFQEEILIANPTSTAANVTVVFLLSSGTEVPITFQVPATSRYTLRVNEVPGLENANASAVVSSDNTDILVERSMYWLAGKGGHNSVGVAAPAPKWYLAEGALGFFETYVLIANPGNTQAEVKVSYLQTGGGVIERTLSVAARSRRTISVQDPNDPAGAPDAGAFSTVVETTNGTNIVVERAMYWNGFEGGHNAVGVTAPSLNWRFAEGFTGTGFTTYLLIGNPNAAAAAQVNVTFLFDDGTTPLVRPYTLEPNSRTTINANDANVFPELQHKAFSIVVDSTNATPVIAERAIYVGDFSDGTATAGLTAEATKWGFAEGLEDRFNNNTSDPFETFYLLANNTDTAADVTATFYREDGTGIVRTLTLNPKSRTTLSGKSYPELSNQRFAAFFESTNSVNFSAERAVYWANRSGGHGSTGTAWTGPIAAPPTPPAVTIASITGNVGSVSGGQNVTVTGTNFTRDTQVSIGGAPAVVLLVIDSTRVIARTPGHAAGTVEVTVASNGVSATLPGAFTYVADAPPPPPPNRTPDPAPGQLLPLPNMAGIVAEVAGQYPGALRNSCQEHGGSWEFLDRLVARLRQFDTRWGYNCKRGNCPDISQDVVAYHAGAGPEVNGALETYTVDVISNHCGGNPVPWWDGHRYVPGPGAARWHSRFQF
jgi:hypothetical protein